MSTEDDVEVRRVTVVNQSTRIREIDVTSYAEIVLAPPADDLAHPAFGKLFLETEYLADSAALLCHRRPRDPRDPAVWAVHVLSLEGRPQGPVEWETDRARFIGRGRDTDRPAALDGRARCRARRASCSIPSFSLRQRIRLVPGASVRLSFATGIASDRETAEALAQKYRDPSAASRTFALAFTHAQSGLRHLGISNDEALLFERLASRVLFADGSLRAGPDTIASNELGQAGLWPHGISGDLPMLLVRVIGDDDVALVRQVLQAQEYWRLKGLSADVVILNEDPSSYLDEIHAQLTALLDNGPWRMWKHRSGGAYLLRGDLIGKAERTLLEAVARAVLGGDRGDLRAQLDKPHPVQDTRRPAFAAVVVGVDRLAVHRPADRAAVDDVDERPRRLHRRGAGLRDRARGRPGNAAALGERHREPPLRHHRHGVGLGAHLVGEQPRKPADVVRQRSRRRSDGRSPVHSRRRIGGRVVAHAGTDDTAPDERAVRRPSFGRRHAVSRA